MGTEIKRKLASIQRIEEVRDIENADAIQAYRVLGWWVVDKKDAHKVGDLVVYLSLDSWVPHELAPFLSKGQEPREYNGVKGERLRTVKLRGQISQGLLLKISDLFEFIDDIRLFKTKPRGLITRHAILEEGEDVTDLLGIQKWEPPLDASLAGQVRGFFPTHLVPKTDQERIQNCFEEIQAKGDVDYEVSMKLDGTSCTIFRFEDELRVCSRNLELKINEENKGNTLVAMALKIGDQVPNNIAFQGEMWGEGIQGNKEKIKGQQFSVFDVYDIETQSYLTPTQRRQLCSDLGIDHVPVIDICASAPTDVEDGLSIAAGPSIHAEYREGVVYKCNEDPSFSFKVINNDWLIQYKE